MIISEYMNHEDVKSAIREMVELRTKAEHFKEDAKAVAQALKDQFEIPVSESNKVVTAILKENAEENMEIAEEVYNAVESIK